MTGSNVIANFAHAVAVATSRDELQKVGSTYRKDIRAAGVREICAGIFTQRQQELDR